MDIDRVANMATGEIINALVRRVNLHLGDVVKIEEIIKKAINEATDAKEEEVRRLHKAKNDQAKAVRELVERNDLNGHDSFYDSAAYWAGLLHHEINRLSKKVSQLKSIIQYMQDSQRENVEDKQLLSLARQAVQLSKHRYPHDPSLCEACKIEKTILNIIKSNKGKI